MFIDSTAVCLVFKWSIVVDGIYGGGGGGEGRRVEVEDAVCRAE